MTRTSDPDARRVQRTERLPDLLRERILILDGAMGTMIQTYELDEAAFRGERFVAHPSDLRGANDLLVLTRPDVIEDIHSAYLSAGADVISTNTFNANAVSMADYGLEAITGEMNLVAARIARRAADAAEAADPGRPRFVAGALGPTTRTASLSPDVNDPGARSVTWDELVAAYTVAARGLAEGGADILLIETIFDTLNAKAAIFAVEGLFEELGYRLPVIDQRHHHGCLGSDPVGTDRGGVLGQRAACAALEHRPQLRARRQAAAAVSPGAVGHRGRVRVGVPECRAAQRLRGL